MAKKDSLFSFDRPSPWIWSLGILGLLLTAGGWYVTLQLPGPVVPTAAPVPRRYHPLTQPIPVTHPVPHAAVREPVAATAPAPPPQPIWPISGQVILPFGWVYSPTLKDYRYHDGVDVAAPIGTVVRAALPGKVLSVATQSPLGETVTIQDSGGMTTQYGDLGQVAVQAGSTVAEGQTIGQVGTPGLDEVSEPPHLHFAVFSGTTPVSPLAILPATAG